jgi:hypothetical protein
VAGEEAKVLQPVQGLSLIALLQPFTFVCAVMRGRLSPT